MADRNSKRDKQWDEVDDTSGVPLLPKIDGKITIPKPAPQEGDCIERLEQTEVIINKVVESQPAIRTEDETIIVPVVEEKMVLVKKMVVTSEIHLDIVRENCDDDEEQTEGGKITQPDKRAPQKFNDGPQERSAQ